VIDTLCYSRFKKLSDEQSKLLKERFKIEKRLKAIKERLDVIFEEKNEDVSLQTGEK